MDWWSSFWQQRGDVVWGILLTIIPGYLFYYLQVRPKRFNWQDMNRNLIILAPASVHKSLTVLYEGKQMTRPNILVMRLGNTGRKTIHPTDFEGPITLTFGRPALRTTSQPAVPRPFSYELVERGQSVEITPKLIKAHEYIELQFITDGPLDPPEVKLRFDGKTGPIPRVMSNTMGVVTLIIYLVGAVALALLTNNMPDNMPPSARLSLAFLLILALIAIPFSSAVLTPRWDPRRGPIARFRRRSKAKALAKVNVAAASESQKEDSSV